MRTHTRKIITLVIILAIISIGFGCGKSQKEYANLAQAGTLYAAAIDNLLIATQKISIDTNSERLLQDDALANRTLADYNGISDEDKKLIKTIQQLRQHVALLSRYFGLLYELATSDAPKRAQDAIGDNSKGLIAEINNVSTQLQGSGLIPANFAAAAGPIGNFVVAGIIRKELRNELDLRKDTIQKELLLQEKLLEVLSTRITHDLTITQEARELRLVIKPLIDVSPISNPEGWSTARRTVLTLQLTADELGIASTNVKKLREAFEDLASGKLTLARVNALITDFQTLLTIAEKLKG